MPDSVKQHRPIASLQAQRGAVLMVAIVFLGLLAMLSVTVMRTSTMELRMASNEQERIEGLQKVQAILDDIREEDNYFPVVEEGYLVCKSGDTDTACDTAPIVLDSTVTSLLGSDTVQYRTYYREDSSLPRADHASDKVYDTSFRVAYFDLMVEYEAASERGARSEITQGVQSIYNDQTQTTSAPDGASADALMQGPTS